MDESRASKLIEWVKSKSKDGKCSWCGGEHEYEVRDELHFRDDQGGQLASLAAIVPLRHQGPLTSVRCQPSP